MGARTKSNTEGSALHAAGPCSVDGCSTKAVARELCNKHGAKGECVRQSCTNFAVKRGGQCFKHEPKKLCSVGGCSNIANYKGQLCQTHGGKPCSVDGCTTKVKVRGLCDRHGVKKVCVVDGCPNIAQRKGQLCTKHGGGAGECVFGGCTNKMVRNTWKTCLTHQAGMRISFAAAAAAAMRN